METTEGVGHRRGGGGRVTHSAGLSQVLAAPRLDQPIDGIVGIFGARLYAAVAEVDSLLGVVADMGDVPHRVVGVAQVLQAAWRGGRRRLGRGESRWRVAAILAERRTSPRVEVDQAGRLRIVNIAGGGAVLVFDPCSLAFCAVINIAHANDWRRRRARHVQQPDRLGGVGEPHVELLQKARFVVDGLEDVTPRTGPIAARRDNLDGAVEGVVAGAAGERFSFQQGSQGHLQGGEIELRGGVGGEGGAMAPQSINCLYSRARRRVRRRRLSLKSRSSFAITPAWSRCRYGAPRRLSVSPCGCCSPYTRRSARLSAVGLAGSEPATKRRTGRRRGS